MTTTNTIHFRAVGLLHEHDLDRAICEQLAEQGGVDCEVNIDVTAIGFNGDGLIPLRVRGYHNGEMYAGSCVVTQVGKRVIATYLVNWE